MADTKISALTEATSLTGAEDFPLVQTTTKRCGIDTLFSSSNAKWSGWVYPYTTGWVGTAGLPLTSTSWDGDARSTTAKTVIDLSVVFGAPAGIKAVSVLVTANDSASTTSDCWFVLSPNNTASSGKFFNAPRSGNDHIGRYGDIIPCDANGDVYFQCNASGASTLDIKLEIWGYCL